MTEKNGEIMLTMSFGGLFVPSCFCRIRFYFFYSQWMRLRKFVCRDGYFVTVANCFYTFLITFAIRSPEKGARQGAGKQIVGWSFG